MISKTILKIKNYFNIFKNKKQSKFYRRFHLLVEDRMGLFLDDNDRQN
jgi:hypothetical protein